MFESKYSKLLTGLLIAGIIIVILTLVGIGIYIFNSAKLKKDAEEAANRYNGSVNKIEEDTTSNTVVSNEVAPIIGIENIVNGGDTNTSEGKKETYKGFTVLGTIEIPAINLKSVVLESSSKEAIEVAVGVYEEDITELNLVGNTTIVGHNYRNGTFFSNNKKLVEGDKIYITDSTGKKITYTIYKTYITTPEDSSHLYRDTAGKREVTLTTCTDDTQSRLIILAKEA